MRKIVGLGVRVVGLTTICVVLLTAVFVLYSKRSDQWWHGQCVRYADGTRKCRSTHLGHEITAPPDVFAPAHASRWFLPLMEENADLFRGKSVLDIGVGSGIISLYAALLGAERVVSTDINPAALETTRLNAAEIGVADLIETRLVSGDDISAYSVIQPGERFDFIGYEVRHHNPIRLDGMEARILFNSYLARLLENEGIEPDAFRFDARETRGRRGDLLRKFGSFVQKVERSGFWPGVEPLLPGGGGGGEPDPSRDDSDSTRCAG